MEFCDSVMELPIWPPICTFLVVTKKLGSDQKSLHFRMFTAKRREFKIGERDGHGKSRNGHGKVMEKYIVKSVGTLRHFYSAMVIEE